MEAVVTPRSQPDDFGPGVFWPSDFWTGKSVFLTGHTGFKGTWLSLWLTALGAQVHGYALAPPTTPSAFDLAGLGDKDTGDKDTGNKNLGGLASHTLGDIGDLARLQAAMEQAAPDIVIHMAAQPLVLLSYDQPVETFATNVLGTAHVLQAMRAVKSVRALVSVTTDKCYANHEQLWGYRETDALGGHDPYSSSKACAELVTACFRDSFFPAQAYGTHGVAIATARAGNVIGGGDFAADRLVPDIMRAVMAGAPPDIRNPDAVRPWQHVLEPLSGYLRLAERLFTSGPAYAQAWNFGPPEGNAHSVGWLADRLGALWQNAPAWRRVAPPAGRKETSYLQLDITKARRLLDWQPRWDIDATLAATVEWYRAYAGGAALRPVMADQIARYSHRQGGLSLSDTEPNSLELA